MTPRLSNFLFFVAIFLLSAPGRADVDDFSSYDECILESLKGVSSDVAANAIIASCRSKFPEVAAVEAAPAEPAPPQESVQAEQEAPAEAAPAAAAAAASGESRELTKEELGKLKATLFGGFTTKYKVTFENFNENVTITEVTIAVWDELDPRGLKKYTETMNVPPSGKQQVAYTVVYMGDDQGWRWKVDSAKGVD